MGAAFILASLTPSVSAAATGSATAGGSGAAQRHSLSLGAHVPGAHVPSAAERRALPATLRSVATAVSGPWYIPNRNSNKDMEVYHSQTQNGAKVDQYDLNQTKTQQWLIVSFGTGNIIHSFINVNSGKCLDNTGTLANGTQMTIWQCEDGNQNQWFWINSPSDCTGCFNFGPWADRGGKCVEVYLSSTANYAKVDEYTCNGTHTQEWYRYAP